MDSTCFFIMKEHAPGIKAWFTDVFQIHCKQWSSITQTGNQLYQAGYGCAGNVSLTGEKEIQGRKILTVSECPVGQKRKPHRLGTKNKFISILWNIKTNGL